MTKTIEGSCQGADVGIIDILRKLFGKPTNSEQSPELNHRRYHARYPIIDRSLCLLEHPTQGMFQIIDLSFNGCLVAPVMGSSFEGADTTQKLSLTMLGRNIDLLSKQVQRRRGGWAVIFHHDNEQSLLALSKIVEPLRCGFSAISMPVDATKDGGKVKMRQRYSGDGPFDLLVERAADNTITFAMVTIRKGERI